MTNRSPEGDVAVIGRRVLLRVVLGKWWLVLLTTVLGASMAFLYSSAQPVSHTATAQVLLRPVLWSPLRGSEEVNPETEVLVATSSVVAERASQALGDMDDPAALAKHVDVSAAGAGDVLNIAYSDGNAVDAVNGAAAFAEAYLAFRSEDAHASAEQYRAPLVEQIASLDAQITATRRRLESTSSASSQYDRLVERLTDAIDTRQMMRDQLAPLTTLSTDAGELLGVSQAGGSAATPTKQLALVVGAIFGMMVGIVLAFALAKDPEPDVTRGSDRASVNGDLGTVEREADAKRTERRDKASDRADR